MGCGGWLGRLWVAMGGWFVAGFTVVAGFVCGLWCVAGLRWVLGLWVGHSGGWVRGFVCADLVVVWVVGGVAVGWFSPDLVVVAWI